jgi:type I restriction enzyme S subunit
MILEAKLSDVAEITMGQSPTGSTCNETGCGMPLLNGPTEFGHHHPTPVQFTTNAKKTANAGDLLFCVRGSTTGKMNWADKQYAIGRGIASLRHRRGRDYQPFLRAIVELHLPTLLACATGSTFPNVSYSQIAGLKCHIPPLPEQKAIAEILGSLDDKIELNRKMNETLEAMAMAIFKSWFVDFDPVHAKSKGRKPDGMDSETAKLFPSSFEDSKIGSVPKGWEPATFREILVLHDSKRIPLSSREREQRRGCYPYHGATSVMDYVDDYLFDGVYLLIGEDGSVVTEDDTPVTQYVWGKFWVNNHAHVATGRRGFSVEHLLLCLKTINIRPFVTGAVQPKLNQGNLFRVPILLPPIEVCQCFASVIDPLFQSIRVNEEQSVTLRNLRDSLLPKLLSGELTVPASGVA